MGSEAREALIGARERADERDPAKAEPAIRGEAIFVALERPLLWIEWALGRVFPSALNPLTHSGAIANTLLVVAVASGTLLLFWYSPSVHQAYASMQVIEATFFPRFVRSLHRYSSDACVFFVALHAMRLVLARRFTGARWLAWVTGLASTALVWLVGWLGYWLVWDERARQVALGTARMLDELPIFGDPLSRSFLLDASVNSLLFFIVFFLHMLVPIALAVTLWLHIARLQRPHYLARGALGLVVCGLVSLISVAVPATVALPAKMTAVPGALSLDYWYLSPLWLTDRFSGGELWLLVLSFAAVAVPLPWLLRKQPARAALVTTSRCNACEQCATDCPYEAIQLVPRTDGRPFKVQAQVDPSRCVGCGICVGSCSTAGTSLPHFDMLERRAKVETLIDGAQDKPGIVFACTEALPDQLRPSEHLPGFVLERIPCAGWLQAVSVERALKHGAREVVVIGCTGCRFREGHRWTEARLFAERRVALTTGRDKVRLIASDRAEAVAKFVAKATGREPKSRLPRLALQLGIAAAAMLVVVGGSVLPYAPPQPRSPELVLSVKQSGATTEACRERSAEELAQLAPHMRQPRVCERRRADVTVRVQVDGDQAITRTYAPQGLWGDGTSVGFERIALTPGTHDIAVTIDDGKTTYSDERRLVFGDSGRHVLLFERTSGFHWQ
jgi:ferredoxin